MSVRPGCCQRNDCERPAVCALGVAFYPKAVVMAFYKTLKPITRCIMGLHVCGPCFEATALAGAAALLGSPNLEGFVTAVERASGTMVDPDRLLGCKVVRVRFTDPDYLQLLAHRGHAQPGQPALSTEPVAEPDSPT